jgi:hypothetical protein
MVTSKLTKRIINPGGQHRTVTQWYGDDAVFLSAGGYHPRHPVIPVDIGRSEHRIGSWGSKA